MFAAVEGLQILYNKLLDSLPVANQKRALIQAATQKSEIEVSYSLNSPLILATLYCLAMNQHAVLLSMSFVAQTPVMVQKVT